MCVTDSWLGKFRDLFIDTMMVCSHQVAIDDDTLAGLLQCWIIINILRNGQPSQPVSALHQ